MTLKVSALPVTRVCVCVCVCVYPFVVCLNFLMGRNEIVLIKIRFR